jgi:hypothetical protein
MYENNGLKIILERLSYNMTMIPNFADLAAPGFRNYIRR